MTWRKWFFVGIAFLLLIGVTILSNSVVFAQELIPWGIRAEYDLWGMQTFAQNAERWLRVVYLIMRPMLALAWAAMDNSLVYGEAFFLTPALFKFWNIIRTFANFALGFYFLRKILSAFFNNKLESWYFALIKKVFIAWVLINFSWSIIASLIDISTIATVSLWGIPIHALQWDTTFKDNVYYLKTHANLNLNDANAEKSDRFDFSVIYSCYPWSNTTWWVAPEKVAYYLPCAINNQQLYPSGSPSEPWTRENRKENFVSVWKSDVKIDTSKIEDNYCVYNNKLIANQFSANIGQCSVLQDLMIQWRDYWIHQCAQINDLITRSRYYTGPLFAMYTSIINVADMWVTSNSWSLKQVWLTLLIKLITIGALLVPLIAFAVVMIIRVIYIWMIIIFSPLIVLVMSLERSENISGKIEGAVQNIFNVAEIVKLILLPAIVTFALSISIIFLTLLHNLPLIESSVWTNERAMQTTDGCRNDTITALWYDRKDTPEWTMYDFGSFEINLTESLRRTWADIGNILSWLWLNGLWIALMRMVVFAALKSSEFTKWVVDSIESTAKSIAWTVPFIPIGDGKSIWLDTLKDAPKTIKNELVWRANQEQTNILKDFQQKTFGQEKWTLNKAFDEAAQSPTVASWAVNSWLNTVSVPQWTDFRDYKSAPQAFAKQAQTWFDTQKDPNNPGKKLWENPEIKNSLAGIKTWEDALKNQYFVKNMHDNPANKKWNENGYDSFLPTWDQRSSKDEQTANLMEEWLKAMAWAKPLDNTANKNITWYIYDDNTKITLFERNPKTGMLLNNKTQSRTIQNPNITEAKDITTKDIEMYNSLLKKQFTLWDEVPLFKILNEKKDQTINNWSIKRNADWSWYTVIPTTNNN
jgi:hypothetical protein